MNHHTLLRKFSLEKIVLKGGFLRGVKNSRVYIHHYIVACAFVTCKTYDNDIKNNQSFGESINSEHTCTGFGKVNPARPLGPAWVCVSSKTYVET